MDKRKTYLVYSFSNTVTMWGVHKFIRKNYTLNLY